MNRMNNSSNQESTLAVSLTVGQLRALIRDELVRSTGQRDHGIGGAMVSSPEASRPYLTVKEAADMARLGFSTIRLYISKRELKAHQVGSRVIIKRTDLERFLEVHPIEVIDNL